MIATCVVAECVPSYCLPVPSSESRVTRQITVSVCRPLSWELCESVCLSLSLAIGRSSVLWLWGNSFLIGCQLEAASAPEGAYRVYYFSSYHGKNAGKGNFKRECHVLAHGFRRDAVCLIRKGMHEMTGHIPSLVSALGRGNPSAWPVYKFVGTLSWLIDGWYGRPSQLWWCWPWAGGHGVYRKSFSRLWASQ